MKLKDGHAVSNAVIGKSKDTPKVNEVEDFHEDMYGRNRFHVQSTRIRRSTRSQNGSGFSDGFVLRCVGSSWYSCRKRCSKEWDRVPIVTRL